MCAASEWVLKHNTAYLWLGLRNVTHGVLSQYVFFPAGESYVGRRFYQIMPSRRRTAVVGDGLEGTRKTAKTCLLGSITKYIHAK